jgi:hypothetical protein
MGNNERVKIVFITVVIKEVSTKDFLNKKDYDKDFLMPDERLSLPGEEIQYIVRLDPERKRKDRGKYERVSVEELILHVEIGRQDVGGNDGNKSYQRD